MSKECRMKQKAAPDSGFQPRFVVAGVRVKPRSASSGGFVQRVPNFGGRSLTGSIEFVARIGDASKGFSLVKRAKRAVSRRIKVPASSVSIIGIESY